MALNACDALDRSETRSALAGPIRRMVIQDLRAEDCHAFVRLASVWSTIEDVDIQELQGGCVDTAVNADGLRFCRSPLFEPDDPAFADGCGDLRNIRIRDLRVWKTRPLPGGMLQLHSRMNNVSVENFTRILERDVAPAFPSLDVRFLPGATGFLEGAHPPDQADLTEQSVDAHLRWMRSAAHDMGHAPLVAAFKLGREGALRGTIRHMDRLHLIHTPMRPLPPADWQKGMSR